MKGGRQFGKYVSVAIGSALIDWAFFGALTVFGTYHLYAQMVSRVSGGVFSFVVNKVWSFGVPEIDRTVIEGRRFLLLYLASYLLALSLLYLFADLLGLWTYVAKLFADFICFVFNFVIMRLYVYHKRAGILHFLREGLKALRKAT